jgi:ribosomal protein S18 acetylase RimI-like enzyme
MTSQIDIRPIQDRDYFGISEVENEVYEGHGYDFYFIRMIPFIFRTTCLIAENKGKAVGYCLGALEDYNPSCGWLLSLVVKAEARNQGVGSALMKQCIDLLCARGVKCIKLTVAEDNVGAVHLYQSIGFEVASIENDFFGVGKHRLLMTSCKIGHSV